MSMDGVEINDDVVLEDDKDDDGFLSFRNAIKTYRPDETDDVFSDMADTLLEDLRAKLSAGDIDQDKFDKEVFSGFSVAVEGLGTHTARLVRTKAPKKTVPTLSFPRSNGNRPPRLYYAGDAKVGKFVKVLMRPISIEGQGHEKNFIERLLEDDQYIIPLKKSFKKVFGDKALAHIEQTLMKRHQAQKGTSVHYENFPVFFIPNIGCESDLQASSIVNIEVYDQMFSMMISSKRMVKAYNDKKKAYKAAGKEDEFKDERPAINPSVFVGNTISGKVRNAALNVPSEQIKFLAEMPDMQGRTDVEIWAFVNKGGRFPRPRTAKAQELLLSYEKKHQATLSREIYTSQKQDEALSKIADWLIDLAVSWRREVEEELKEVQSKRDLPSVSTILKGVYLPKDKVQSVNTALSKSHFKKRLDLKGEK